MVVFKGAEGVGKLHPWCPQTHIHTYPHNNCDTDLSVRPCELHAWVGIGTWVSSGVVQYFNHYVTLALILNNNINQRVLLNPRWCLQPQRDLCKTAEWSWDITHNLVSAAGSWYHRWGFSPFQCTDVHRNRKETGQRANVFQPTVLALLLDLSPTNTLKMHYILGSQNVTEPMHS